VLARYANTGKETLSPFIDSRADLYYFWHVESDHRRNHPSQILNRLIYGFGCYRCPKSGFPLTLIVALTTVLRTTVLHCDKVRQVKLSN